MRKWIAILGVVSLSLLTAMALARLKKEARIGGRLQHPNLCPVLDVIDDEEAQISYIVMPFIEGKSLARHIERTTTAQACDVNGKREWINLKSEGDRSVEQAHDSSSQSGERLHSSRTPGELPALVRLVETLALALDCLHSAGIIHRDLKPGNIMIRPNGEPVIIDFGLAFEHLNSDEEHRTIEGQILGTPAYMAPEQAEGRVQETDHRADIWALGVILYELLTLQRPFNQKSHRSLLLQISESDPIRPRRHTSNIPPDLEAICLKCLEKEPSRRYQSAQDLALDLKNVRLLRPVSARQLTSLGIGLRWCRRNRSLVLTAAVAALVCLIVVAWVLSDAREGRDRLNRVNQYLVALNRGDTPQEDSLQVAELLKHPQTLSALANLARIDLARALKEADQLVRSGDTADIGPVVVETGNCIVIRIHTSPETRVTYKITLTGDNREPLLDPFVVNGDGRDENGVLTVQIASYEGATEGVVRARWKVQPVMDRQEGIGSMGTF
jgi:serine/threonine protein kinase